MALSCATAEDVLKTIKDQKVQMIDLRFTDLPGVWQHFSIPPSAVDADALNDGIGFDGSSIRGFQEIQESDMLVVPDPSTAFLDPFSTATTLVLICNVRDPVTGQAYSRDARYVAQKHASTRRARAWRPSRNPQGLNNAEAQASQPDDEQPRPKERRPQARPDRRLHAQTAVRRQRGPPAPASDHLEGQDQPVPRQ